MKFKKIKTSGQTLIEVLVALGIIAIIVTALTSVVVTSLGSSRYSKDQNLATQYAQEGLEIMRNLRDSDYVDFRNIPSGSYCLDKNSTVLSPDCFSANVDSFIRKVIITHDGCDIGVSRVEVSVSWNDSRCSSANTYCHESSLPTCLSSVNPVPTF